MDANETVRFEAFAREKRGNTAEEFKLSVAEGTLRCTASRDGFIEGPDVLRSDWGFDPAKLDVEHSNEGDADELGNVMSQWLVESYGYAKLKKISGGHLAELYHVDDAWAKL